MAHVNDTILINAPVDRVFAVGRDPRLWANWWVNQSSPRRFRGDGSAGTVLHCRHMVGGRDLPLKIKVVADRLDNDGSGHWQGDLGGSVHGHECWDYVPCKDGTLVTADIDFTVPRQVSADVTDPSYIERLESGAIHQTLENLKFVLEHTATVTPMLPTHCEPQTGRCHDGCCDDTTNEDAYQEAFDCVTKRWERLAAH